MAPTIFLSVLLWHAYVTSHMYLSHRKSEDMHLKELENLWGSLKTLRHVIRSLH